MYHISLGLSKIIEKSPWFSPLEKHSKQQQGDSPLRGISPLVEGEIGGPKIFP